MTTTNTLFSGGQGATIPTGLIGEIYSSTLSIVTATFTGGVAGVATMASITVTAGVYLIIAEDSCYNATRGTAGTISAGGSDLFDGSAVIVDGQQTSIIYGTANNLDAETFRAIHHNFYTVTTGTKTISFRLKCNANSGLPNGASASNRGYGYLKAIRIA